MIRKETYQNVLLEFFKPLQEYLNDPTVSEILVNGPQEIYVERAGCLQKLPSFTWRRDELLGALRLIAQFTGRFFDDKTPILEAYLPDGSRVEAVGPPLVEQGPYVAIRRFRVQKMTGEVWLQGGGISREALDYLASCVQQHKNILISGGTGSGKTAFLRCLTQLIPQDERIVVLEDARELRLEHPHVVSLEARAADHRGQGQISIRELFRATLRLRPDRIVIGELRGNEALDLLQAMLSGHRGCLSTVHASSPADALRRVETLALWGESSLSLDAVREQMTSAIDVIVQTERLVGGARGVMQISVMEKLCSATSPKLVCVFERREGELRRCGA